MQAYINFNILKLFLNSNYMLGKSSKYYIHNIYILKH